MPLIHTLPPRDRQQLKLNSKFSDLPEDDQRGIITKLKSPEAEGPLSEKASSFLNDPAFQELYDLRKSKILEEVRNLSGLLKSALKQQEQNSEIENSSSNNFEVKLSHAFKLEGARGLARMHRQLLNDPDYEYFIKGGLD